MGNNREIVTCQDLAICCRALTADQRLYNSCLAIPVREAGTGWTFKSMELDVTVGPDFAPHDNSMKLYVTVIPETVITEQEQAVPWILLLVLLDIGAGGMAIGRAVKMARPITGMSSSE